MKLRECKWSSNMGGFQHKQEDWSFVGGGHLGIPWILEIFVQGLGFLKNNFLKNLGKSMNFESAVHLENLLQIGWLSDMIFGLWSDIYSILSSNTGTKICSKSFLWNADTFCSSNNLLLNINIVELFCSFPVVNGCVKWRHCWRKGGSCWF